MTLEQKADRLFTLWNQITDIGSAQALLSWDQETQMPARGLEGRARALSTLAAIQHDLLTNHLLQEAIDELETSAEPGSDLAAQAAWARRKMERAVKVPAALARELAEAGSRSLAAWQKARDESDFSVFRPLLARMIELKKEEAAAVSDSGLAYDALLEEFEPGATVADLGPLFAELRAELSPIVQAVAESGVSVDESPARGEFNPGAQKRFGLDVAAAIGFDFDAGRLDRSAHPFCTGIDPGDVRMTWRWEDDDFRPALYGVVHETGHGLYEQGLPEKWRGTPLGQAVSLGIHESQSRLWENHVARSRPFWEWALPRFQALFPSSAATSVDEIWPTLHVVKPCLIRVEADEVTYHLHVAIRFEIERAIFADEIQVDDLPERWDDLYEEMLGVRSPDAAQGVLQDIHWALGAFGYFPTYSLGTLAAAQLYEAAGRDIDGLDPSLAAGDFKQLLEWLRATIHRYGSRYEPAELIRRATGEPLSSRAFLAHVRGHVNDIYGIST
jgi:carboxypeptidase Taq